MQRSSNSTPNSSCVTRLLTMVNTSFKKKKKLEARVKTFGTQKTLRKIWEFARGFSQTLIPPGSDVKRSPGAPLSPSDMTIAPVVPRRLCGRHTGCRRWLQDNIAGRRGGIDGPRSRSLGSVFVRCAVTPGIDGADSRLGPARDLLLSKDASNTLSCQLQPCLPGPVSVFQKLAHPQDPCRKIFFSLKPLATFLFMQTCACGT